MLAHERSFSPWHRPLACHSERSEESTCQPVTMPSCRFFAALRMTGRVVLESFSERPRRLAPALASLTPWHLSYLLKQFGICYNVFNIFFSALRITMTRNWRETP